jgi:hypothetical protein
MIARNQASDCGFVRPQPSFPSFLCANIPWALDCHHVELIVVYVIVSDEKGCDGGWPELQSAAARSLVVEVALEVEE